MKPLQYKTIATRLPVLALSVCMPAVCMLAVCVLGVLAPSDALAQDASRAKRAQQAFDEGMSHYTEKKYAEAVTEFRKGYSLMPAGMFLYNIALSYIKLGEYAKARRYAKRADGRDDLPKKARVKNAARIDALGIRLHAATVADAIEPAEPDDQTDLIGSKDPKVSEAPGSREPKGGVGMWTYAGLGTAVVGAGLVGGALYMGSDLEARIDHLAQVTDRGEYDQMRASIESDRTVGQVLLVSGIGLVAAGSGLVVWDLLGADEQSGALSVQPQLGSTTGARVRWEW